jgi:glycosyltransferase involved in cell wall biosynthesis
MKIVMSTVGFGRSGGTESIARDVSWGLLRRGYDFEVLTEVSVGDHTPLKVTNDIGILQRADLILQVGVFSFMDWEVMELKRRKFFDAPVFIWCIEPESKFFMWMTDPHTGVQQNKLMFGYSVEYARHRMQMVGMSHLGFKIRYGIPSVIGRPGFKKKRNIATSRMFLSAGGFDKRKCQHELIKAFVEAKLPDTTLVVTGHRCFNDAPKEQDGVRVIVPDDRQELMDAMLEADLLIMNSNAEGYGLVLLEAMFNKTRWAANRVGAAIHKEDLADYGYVYDDEEGLKKAFQEYEKLDVMKAYRYAAGNHTIDCMMNDVEAGIKQLLERQ